MKKMVSFLRLDFPEVILRLVTFAQKYQIFTICAIPLNTKYMLIIAMDSQPFWDQSKTWGLRLALRFTCANDNWSIDELL